MLTGLNSSTDHTLEKSVSEAGTYAVLAVALLDASGVTVVPQTEPVRISWVVRSFMPGLDFLILDTQETQKS